MGPDGAVNTGKPRQGAALEAADMTKTIVASLVIFGAIAAQNKPVKSPPVLRPDGAIPARFVHHRVDLTQCLDVKFTDPRDFTVESYEYKKKVTISIDRPGIADCTMENK